MAKKHKVLFGLLLLNGKFSKNRLYRAIEVHVYHVRQGNNTIIQLNSETIEKIKKIINTLQSGLFGDDPLATG